MRKLYSVEVLTTQHGKTNQPFIKIPAILITGETAFHIYDVLIRKNGSLQYWDLKPGDEFRINDGNHEKKKDKIKFVEPFHVDFLGEDNEIYASHILAQYSGNIMCTIINDEKQYVRQKAKIVAKYKDLVR